MTEPSQVCTSCQRGRCDRCLGDCACPNSHPTLPEAHQRVAVWLTAYDGPERLACGYLDAPLSLTDIKTLFDAVPPPPSPTTSVRSAEEYTLLCRSTGGAWESLRTHDTLEEAIADRDSGRYSWDEMQIEKRTITVVAEVVPDERTEQ